MAQPTLPPDQGQASGALNLRFLRAVDLFRAVPQIAQDMTTRVADEDGLTFLAKLLAGPTPEEAITFAAYALTPRHAVWWGHECLQSLPEVLSDTDRAMLTLVAIWAADPGEANRYGALEAAQAAAERSPGVWVAMGAGWSSGSMAPMDSPEVPCMPFLTGRTVNAGVLGILARVPQDQRRRVLTHFVGMAEVLARSA